MEKKALLIVLDSVGFGGAPDAGAFGDQGADTLGHLFSGIPGLELPNLDSLGLARLMGRKTSAVIRDGSSAFRLTELSAGKDTTSGHWEMMGCELNEPFFACDAFPDDFIEALVQATGTEFIGNKTASGTDILRELGEEHMRTGHPILYTSADSVLQIAAHEEVFGENRLQETCRIARALLDERGMRVGRVISRPFTGEDAPTFRRTTNRHDYSLTPGETVLDRLGRCGVTVTGVGKISDIFAGKGIADSHPTTGNADGMEVIARLWAEPVDSSRFIFANLVDFDSLHGHRRDPEGYARCLMEFDAWLGGFLGKIRRDDLVMITADHGNDPYHSGTDHTREQVPCFVLGDERSSPTEMSCFSDVGDRIEAYFMRK